VIYVVDDDRHVREALRAVLEDDRRIVEDFASCEAFLDSFQDSRDACLLIDAYLPGMDGMELLKRLASDGHRLPSIMITGNSDVTMAVQAMKAGAFDFIEKPVNREELIASVNRALVQSVDKNERAAWTDKASQAIMGLTARQKQIMDMVLAGHPSKNIAADLKISQRTVENHRAAIMQKTGSKSLPALARLALAATSGK
jgi:two-component system CheB/CheR fusion protein